ncbi:acetyl-CoA hydrolase/transferase family protein [Schinkia azotoformans]|uniref:acetyl-CoA hydrolase/transferase family protein n=1 Tax=Schinkia azotoformans TaxID=1454 RepID=UPI002DB892FA|nr:acetyl-CoA hydrolase/transferase C-terminal domain-containing protein [Schinkia azotoformans]MEC1718220.1 acetyl-CoA hydrolase/transferase C-terminal domain-containing protein [Schinkia azotoformans]MEC1740313.1 acetyl-CoA hydrolase/transferase C-terminal domain-containing protein [Schinkia azotoformans]MEC1747193.1 acetyl-CoA hydrolase/transferase C-terminal domain-containing protein [Schinkia azotoformans]MEC1757404.1 acetyl-CoA hydrolase/transferase C-terminal domain-containing protein [S
MIKNKEKKSEEILSYIHDGDDIILPIANGEPQVLLDVLEANATMLKNVRIHQMHTIKERDYIWGKYSGHLDHVSYFLSHATRKAFLEGKCSLVPNNFHEVPRLLEKTTKMSIILATASPMDEHGYFSLGVSADYVAPFIGKVPFFLEVNQQMPRTFGSNEIHISQITGYVNVDYPLFEAQPAKITEADQKIAAFVAERIENGSTIQSGIGAIPNATVSMLTNHKNLGIHTELLADGVMELIEKGVVTNTEKKLLPGKTLATFALGTKNLYNFLHNNLGTQMMPVNYVNDPRIIAQEDNIVSINATTEVDFLGQCASETIQGRYYSSSGGQADFARGAMFAKNGKGFICLHSTAKNGTVSRIQPQLTPRSVVTTSKNDVDHIVTEFGVAKLRGKSISERAKELINITHPDFRDELRFTAKQWGLL